MVFLFYNHLSVDIREPRVPLKILRDFFKNCGRSSFYVWGVEQILRDRCGPRLRAEDFMGLVLRTVL